VETQRQWSDLAILRTIPALLGLFSLVTIFAHQLLDGQSFPVRQAAWYTKALPTFSDTLAFVRQHLWPSTFFVSRLLNTMSWKFHERFSIVWSIRSLSLRDQILIWIKSSLEAPIFRTDTPSSQHTHSSWLTCNGGELIIILCVLTNHCEWRSCSLENEVANFWRNATDSVRQLWQPAEPTDDGMK